MRVGYAKLGQRLDLGALLPDRWASIGSTRDEARVAAELARRNPAWEVVLVGMNTGEDPVTLGYPPNVTNPWTEILPEYRARMRELFRRYYNRDKELGKVGYSYEGKVEIVRLYDELLLPLFRDVDAVVAWSGLHGTSNSPLPLITTGRVGTGWTSPQDSYVIYGSYLTRGIAAWREKDPAGREEVWLVPDVRNILKLRDLKWPRRHPLLGMHDLAYRSIHHRYDDPRSPAECGDDWAATAHPDGTWTARDRYVYSGVELTGVVPEHVGEPNLDWAGRGRFGIFINEADPRAKPARRDVLRDWVLPLGPDWVHGNWTTKSLEELGVAVTPAPSAEYYDRLRTVRSTFTTPSSGSGWATAKPWEAFAAGVACYFHPGYDTQGHILPTLGQAAERPDDALSYLARWLRVDSPEQLAYRVDAVNSSREAWEWVVRTQRGLYLQRHGEGRCYRLIEDRVGPGMIRSEEGGRRD